MFDNETANIALRSTLEKLREAHRHYADKINKREWYVDIKLLNFGGVGYSGDRELDLQSLRLVDNRSKTNNFGYWLPPAELRKHIVAKAKDEIGRLNDVTPEYRNPNFDNFHSRFSSELRDKEINDTVRISLLSDTEISVVKSTYLDQVGTNITADTPIDSLDE